MDPDANLAEQLASDHRCIGRGRGIYTVIEGPDRKPRWLRVGVAFVNHDGSINVRLDALPTNGTLQIRDEVAIATKEKHP